ncbi:MAG: clostripain-related cysteine peptidase [Candidatus Chromulinivorax sp.]
MYLNKKKFFLCITTILIFLLKIDAHQTENESELILEEESVLISQDELVRLICEHENDDFFLENATEEELVEIRSINPKKAYTIIMYIAADNDLHPYAWKNIKQMELVGSNENINIIVQLNTPGYFTPTKRYLIKNGRRLLIPADGNSPTQKLNSGSPYTLIDCVAWAMKYYPADNLILNLWDHGSGVFDPGTIKTINSVDLFKFNETTKMLELNRQVEYANLISKDEQEMYRQNGRGICFDDTYKSYLSNQDLTFALHEIQYKVLGGKKIAVLWFDACLMAMLEVADACKESVDYFVASQEVEFASGSKYDTVLQPFIEQVLTPREFACHVVNSYEKAYQYITKDFTQSALDLNAIPALEQNVDLVATQLLAALQNQKNNSVSKLIQQCKARPYCTCFEEPSYIDLRNFYINLQTNLQKISLQDSLAEGNCKFALAQLLDQGINLINQAVVLNKVGSNLQKACGISIYFPERGIFNSYPKCNFAQTTNWSNLIIKYLLSKK